MPVITVKGNLREHVVILSAVFHFNSCHSTQLFTPFTKLTAASQVHFYKVTEFSRGGRSLCSISYLNLRFLVEDTDAFSLSGTSYAVAQRKCLTCLFKIIQLVHLVLVSYSFIFPVSLFLSPRTLIYRKTSAFPISIFGFTLNQWKYLL